MILNTLKAKILNKSVTLHLPKFLEVKLLAKIIAQLTNRI